MFTATVLTIAHAVVSRLHARWVLFIWSASFCYLALVRLLRWRVYNKLHGRFATRDWARDMTVSEAQEVLHASTVWDMPALLYYALSLTIMRTCAIPSISKVLLRSKEISGGGAPLSKRFLDSAIVLETLQMCPLSTSDAATNLYRNQTGSNGSTTATEDPRAFIGAARVNWLHSHYKISNDDYLYTLALLILEPIRWAREFGWRALSPLEAHARFVLYRHIGTVMNIHSIPDTLEELTAWTEEYEVAHMIPNAANAAIAERLLDALSYTVQLPEPARIFFRGCVMVMVPKRARLAEMTHEPTRIQKLTVHTLIRVSAFTQGYLLPPRVSPPARIIDLCVPEKKAESQPARMHPNWQITGPGRWYIPYPSPHGFSSMLRNVAAAVGYKTFEAEVENSEYYMCEGFRMEEIGPARWAKAGHEKVFAAAEDLLGCPLHGIWAREARA